MLSWVIQGFTVNSGNGIELSCRTRRPQRMKIIGAARRACIKHAPTSITMLNNKLFSTGWVYPLPNWNPIFYLIVMPGAAPSAHENPPAPPFFKGGTTFRASSPPFPKGGRGFKRNHSLMSSFLLSAPLCFAKTAQGVAAFCATSAETSVAQCRNLPSAHHLACKQPGYDQIE